MSEYKWKAINKDTINFTTKDSHGWIQWKGTQACVDIHCAKCGCHSHYDGDFMYFVKCPKCGQIYECNGYIELIPTEIQESDHAVQYPENCDESWWE